MLLHRTTDQETQNQQEEDRQRRSNGVQWITPTLASYKWKSPLPLTQSCPDATTSFTFPAKIRPDSVDSGEWSALHNGISFLVSGCSFYGGRPKLSHCGFYFSLDHLPSPLAWPSSPPSGGTLQTAACQLPAHVMHGVMHTPSNRYWIRWTVCSSYFTRSYLQ